MKIFVLFCNFLITQPDTVVVDYGDPKFMKQDSVIESHYTLRENLPDGIYTIMGAKRGKGKFKKQEIEIRDSKIIVEISFYENSRYNTSNTKDASRIQQKPPIKRKYELLEGNIRKYTEYYENGVINSFEIYDWNLEDQLLMTERRHFKNGSLEMIVKKMESNKYQVKYFYESGELYVLGQFDEFNRPCGIWIYFYENGKKKEEGPVCTECIQKLWRPWTISIPVYRQGLWTYYSKDGVVIKTVEKNER